MSSSSVRGSVQVSLNRIDERASKARASKQQNQKRDKVIRIPDEENVGGYQITEENLKGLTMALALQEVRRG